jgi:hypothetical protein
MFLLIDESEAMFLAPYKKRYQLFEDYGECREEAEKRGFADHLGLHSNIPPVGTMQQVQHGEFKVGILNLDVQ